MSRHLFVTGPARSGTSLMLMLTRYLSKCRIVARGEQNPKRYDTVQKIIEESRAAGESYYVTKQPFGFWEEWGKYDFEFLFDGGSKIICMIRDPRDVAVSHNPHFPDDRYFWRDYSWIRTAQEILKYQDGHEDLLVVRYENLVTKTQEEMERIAAFIGEELLPGYEEFYTHSSVHTTFLPSASAGWVGRRVWATLGGWGTAGDARPIDGDRVGLWRNEEHREYLQEAITEEIRGLAQRLGYDMTGEA